MKVIGVDISANGATFSEPVEFEPTAPEHEHTANIEEAARWVASMPFESRPRPLVPALRERFGLTAAEACAAIREAALANARAH